MKRLLTAKLFLVLLVPTIFLVVALFTLSDYGINWDSPKHFIRGQSYLHFIITGNRNFLDYPVYPQFKGAPDIVDFNVGGATNSAVVKKSTIENLNVRRSFYQSDFYTYDYFMTKHVHTHPEVNDLLVSATNYIFYQKLGILGDIEAYHLFVVLITFTLAVVVPLWTYSQFGIFASVIATASLTLYPLVFAESHFNIKDPVLMSFFGLAILAFWYGFSKSRSSYILLSAILAGFALGTKFNTVFLTFILGPWMLFNLFIRYKDKKRFELVSLLGGRKIVGAILVYPVIVLTILFIFSPYLWANPIGHVMEIVNYYKTIGKEPLSAEMSRFLVGGWNIYPLIWIFYTTPLPILILSITGLLRCSFLIFKKNNIACLILLWFWVPIIRVMWPGANIYGGVRQIMEFIPAMAILSGIGALFLVERGGRLTNIIIATSFLFVVLELISIHPNENVYFNPLINGLKGAKKFNMPAWGNSYGNVYLQGINWLNEHAEKDAKLALAENYISVIPRLKLRSDIDLDNHHWSGTAKKGEYAMEMYNDSPLQSLIRFAYYDTFLDPVYQVNVQGVPILKIWKNDLEHTRRGFEKEVEIKPKSIILENQKLKVDFEKQVFLTKIIINHSSEDCQKQDKDGFIAISPDGNDFDRQPDPFINLESPESSPGMDENTFVYLLAAKPALSLIFNPEQSDACILKNIKVEVWGLAK